MKRRAFLQQSALLTGGYLLAGSFPATGMNSIPSDWEGLSEEDLYRLFRDPPPEFRPFVRWWWNGDKIEDGELVRELRLMKEAGIGGVEINPIAFPTTGEDLGKKSLVWLSDEWIGRLMTTFAEAKRLGMACDLLVGSGWPFGSEDLSMNERAQAVLLYAEKLEGPKVFETSQYSIFKAVDPEVTVPNPARIPEIVSVKLVPDPMGGLAEVTDMTDKAQNEIIRFEVPPGRFYLHVLVRFRSFASVINGAPGASGPVLNHLDAAAVRKYLVHMSDSIQQKTGPLSGHIRALFTDSMELEGSNWTDDLAEEFRKRRGYDILPYLPFILFKTGRLGAVTDEYYGVPKTSQFLESLRRVRFDFELTRAELLLERFSETYYHWCRELQVRSRAQAYGRGFFPLETSLGCDIPEGESWTTNWLKHRIGEEMPDEDYRRGRGYTWINKFVSSAAHLSGKRIVSCEEMTNTYNVFNESLELLKIGSDQSLLSGISHSVWHGFNYSPPEVPFPGWVQYGSYLNENNNLWPYFRFLNDYKARISALLQHSEMYTDIAILPAIYDLWSDSGVQTDPFPEKLNVPYTSLIWEAIHKTGGGADFTSEKIIQNSGVSKGKFLFGKKEYGTLFLVEVTSIFPDTLVKLFEFIESGGRVICIGKYPDKSPGFKDSEQNDLLVKKWVEKLKSFPDRFILAGKPETGKILEWYQDTMVKQGIPHYLSFGSPDRFMMQNRYRSDDGNEVFFFSNANRFESRKTKVTFSGKITRGRFPWNWDPETGEKFRLKIKENTIDLELGPAESRLIIFSKKRKGTILQSLPTSGEGVTTLNGPWEVEFRHSRENWIKTKNLNELIDLKNTEFVNFTGTAVYRSAFVSGISSPSFINLGQVSGITELMVNGKPCGVKWYGRRIYHVATVLEEGKNDLEIRVITSMGNYMKTLTGNPTAQKFTVQKAKDQPIQSMGLIGPVTLY